MYTISGYVLGKTVQSNSYIRKIDKFNVQSVMSRNIQNINIYNINVQSVFNVRDKQYTIKMYIIPYKIIYASFDNQSYQFARANNKKYAHCCTGGEPMV